MRRIILISIIIIFICISCVSAENVTDSTNTTDLSHLNKEISSSDFEVNFTHDYTYNKTSDRFLKYGIGIYKNITINGNNHVIDADGSSALFRVYSSTVTINNLVIKNSGTSIRASNSKIITNNVTFLNSNEWSNFIGYNSSYTSINDSFIDNCANSGSAIAMSDSSRLILINATLKTTKPLNWGLISLKNSQFTILNCRFSDIASNYTGAVYARNSSGVIRNSRFTNMHADKTGGAIAFKQLNGAVTIDNCTFINSTSRKNGGAVYTDCGESPNQIVYLKNSQFINCSSLFGGAYLQLDGRLDVGNCSFKNTHNPLYTSGASTTIRDSEFTKSLQAIYFDNSYLKIINSRFTDCLEICIYESQYQISQSLFNRTDIISYFDGKNSKLNKNTYIASKCLLNQAKYSDVIGNNVSGIDCYQNTVFLSDTVNKNYFNLKDYNLISPVKNQGSSGSCWAFAMVSAFESALARIGIHADISENNLRNLALKYSSLGETLSIEGGDSDYALTYLLSWLGPVNEEDDDYDELGKISQFFPSGNTRFAIDGIDIDYYGGKNDIKNLKKYLVEYGAVYASVNADFDEGDYYNYETNAAYYNGNSFWNTHAVCIVGWNDTFSRSNFLQTPKGDGAWIVKNSWGSEWGDEGYYYISYYDYALNPSLVFKINPEIYNRNYQYDYIYYISSYDIDYSRDYAYGNYFTAKGDDLIAAVGTYFYLEDIDYEIRIYLNDKLVYKQEGYSKFAGFNTIKLKSLVSVNKNDKFRVEVFSFDVPTTEYSRTVHPPNTSYYKVGGKIHFLNGDTTVLLKAYTISNPLKVKNIATYYKAGKTKFTIKNIDTKRITVKIDGKKYTLKVKNHRASISLKLKKGSHKVTTYYKNKMIISQIYVKSKIKCPRTHRVFSHSKEILKVKFMDAKKRKVTVKFNKRTIKAKTNSKGILKIRISPKLKKGEYIIKLTHPVTKEKVNVNVKVISCFKKDKNMKMYYFDGSAYKFQLLKGKGKTVTVKIDGKSFRTKTDSRGWAAVKISSKILPGKHKIRISYNGEVKRHVLVVKNIIKKINVKKTSKKLIVKVTLKKKVENRKLGINVNGKHYTVKISKKTAKLTIKKPKKKICKISAHYYRTGLKRVVKI